MPLLIDLVRHGEAEPSSPEGNSGRRLTPAGEAAVRALAARVAASGTLPSRVFASPLKRAQQTAHVLIVALGIGSDPETIDELDPDYPSQEVIEALEARGITSGHVMLVGHMPQLDHLHSLLTGHSLPFFTATLNRVILVSVESGWVGRPVLTLKP
jgi:phosphohistidine phosphatase